MKIERNQPAQMAYLIDLLEGEGQDPINGGTLYLTTP